MMERTEAGVLQRLQDWYVQTDEISSLYLQRKSAALVLSPMILRLALDTTIDLRWKLAVDGLSSERSGIQW